MKYKLTRPKQITAIITVVAVIFIVIAVWPENKQTIDNQDDKVIKVMAEVIGTAKLAETIPVTGSFEALTSVEIVPEISGQLKRLRLADNTPVDIGVAVKAGQVIAVIDADSYLAQLAESQAALEASKVALADAEREKKRIIRLFEGGSSTERARASVKQAQAALARIRVTVDKATIEAPVTGIVSRKYVDEGNMVGPSTSLVRIVQIETLKVLGGVSERYLPQLEPGKTPVQIETDAYPEDKFEGTVFRVGVAVDSVTRTGEVEIRVPNPDRKLKPGMFARMTIVVGEKEDVVVVPNSALIREYDNDYVFVANGGKARRRRLELGLSQGRYYEVLKGLTAGDIVITHGQRQLEDGQMAEVVQEEQK